MEEEISKCCYYEPRTLVGLHVKLEKDIPKAEKYKGRDSAQTAEGETAQAGGWRAGEEEGS